MTTVTTEKVRHFKSNPDCPATKHAPTIDNWRRGCLCPGPREQLELWAQDQAAGRTCAAPVHSATNTAWREGCRHAGAIIAHEDWKMGLRRDRKAAVDHYRRTGQCGAETHGTVGAFRRGCRCERARERWETSHDGKNLARLRGLFGAKLDNPWRQGKMAVSRTNLWLLVHGFVDSPTVGERLAAVAILSQRHPRVLHEKRHAEPMSDVMIPFLTTQEIAARIGADENSVRHLRKKRAELRAARTARRLADVRCKAERVARAAERAGTKESERGR